MAPSAGAPPAIVFAHYGGLRFFDDREVARIAEVGRVLDPEALGSWDDPRADALLAQAEVIVGHWGCPPLDSAALARAPRLGLFAYAAGTVKGVVDDAVFAREVRVTSGADANAEPVAEFTLAAILFANKRVPWARDDQQGRSPGWPSPPGAAPIGNYAKTIGLVGASLVGRRVIELLAPFPHLAVAVHDPYLDEAEAVRLGVRLLPLDELCAEADVLSIHAPDLPSTHHMIGADQLAALRPGATLINTARGALVDHDALLAELTAGRICAFLDVTDPEPLSPDHPLRGLPNVFLTPHLAGSEGTELGRLTDHVVEEIRRWQAGEPAANEVTKERLARMA